MDEKSNAFIEELIINYHNELYKTARRHFNNDKDVEDVISELWLIAVIKIKELYIHPNKIGWLYKTLGFCIKRVQFQNSFRLTQTGNDGKKITTFIQNETVPLDDISLNKIQYFEKYYEGEIFEEYKEILTEDELQYLLYRFRDNLSNQEIADNLNKNYSSITSLGYRVKKKIKKFLK